MVGVTETLMPDLNSLAGANSRPGQSAVANRGGGFESPLIFTCSKDGV